MAALEREGYAHSDISQGNLIVEQKRLDVQLLDLEDMYLPGAPAPAQDYKGSPGYRHRSGDQGATTWCQEGDRYASAVLAAEMLVLTDKKATNLATDTGYFIGHCQDPVIGERYNHANELLKKIAPGFAKLFDRAWQSESLSDCPKISDLREAISEDASNIRSIRVAQPPPKVRGVDWITPGVRPPETDDEPESEKPRRKERGAPAGFWQGAPQSSQASEGTGSASPPQESAVDSPLKIGIIILVVLSLIILLAILFSLSSDYTGVRPDQPGVATDRRPAQTPVENSITQQDVRSPTPPVLEASRTNQTEVSEKLADRRGSSNNPVTRSSIDGVWQFSVRNQNCSLAIRDGVGVFETETLYPVDQEVTAHYPSGNLKGIILKGGNPVLVGSQIRPPNYASDEILIQRQADGSFRVWARDNANMIEWDGFKVKSFRPGSRDNPGLSEDLTLESIEGVWEFTDFSPNRYVASLAFNEGRGILRTQTRLVVDQLANAEITDQGILVICSNLVLRGTTVRAPTFSPDQLLFLQQADGSFKAWIRDEVNIKDWTSMMIKSHKLN